MAGEDNELYCGIVSSDRKMEVFSSVHFKEYVKYLSESGCDTGVNALWVSQSRTKQELEKIIGDLK